MALQSRVLLTRPAAQSARFAAALLARFPGVQITHSPLMAPELLTPDLPSRPWTAVIFTSETGVLSARRIAADGTPLPHLALCVGDQTADAARAQGFSALSAQGDGQALLHLIRHQNITGPLLYLHGAEVKVDFAGILNSAGTETYSAISYAQKPQPLTPEAVALLHGTDAVVAPVFSARTGQILSAEYARITGTAPLYVAAISADAAAACPGATTRIAKRPDAASMLQAMALWLA